MKSLVDSVSIETIVLLESLKLFNWNLAHKKPFFTTSNISDHSLNMQGPTNQTENHLDQNNRKNKNEGSIECKMMKVHGRRDHPVTDTLNFFS